MIDPVELAAIVAAAGYTLRITRVSEESPEQLQLRAEGRDTDLWDLDAYGTYAEASKLLIGLIEKANAGPGIGVYAMETYSLGFTITPDKVGLP